MKRFLSVFVCLVLLTAMLMTGFSLETAATGGTETKRAIAIVFDNSASMYQGTDDFKQAWCRATYAMEVLATMMNPSDTMVIYPMHPIQVGVDGTTYDSDNPLKVTQATASTIRQIYTPKAGTTPIESIKKACDGLVGMDAAEKWLIVLTDGSTFYRNNKELSVSATIQALKTSLTDCVERVNTMYLGIGPEVALPTGVSGSYRYIADQAKDSSSVLSKLTDMCNTIFGRDTLSVTSKEITFDVSMKKLIVFVQGKGISNVSLSGATPVSTNELKYPTLGAKDRPFLIDESLQGVMLTFGEMDAGKYSLSYSGTATSVVAYYEPDIDLKVVLKDAAGTVVDPKEEQMAGSYTIEYCLVDRNGKVTNSKLLGNVNYDIKYTINGEQKSVTANKAGKLDVQLDSNSELDADFTVTYLSGYTIHRTGTQLGWPSGGIKTGPPPAGELKMTLVGAKSSYALTEFASEQVVRIDLVYEGDKVVGAELDKVTVIPNLQGGNVTCELKRDDNGYYVALNKNGSLLDTKPGKYKLAVSGVYTTVDGLKSNKAIASTAFELKDNSGKLAMSLKVDQDYYEISKLKDGKPIRVDLTLGGKPLTDEQLAAVKLDCQVEGLKLIQEPIKGESAINVRIDPESSPEDDSYEIKFKASCKNEIGRDVAAEDETEIEVRTLPLWLRILIPLLILLILFLLIWWITHQKVLPKRVATDKSTTFTVDGNPITGKPDLKFVGAGKKRGTLTIMTPKCHEPQARAGLMLTLEAVTCRYKPSHQRRMRVVAISELNKIGMQYYTVKSINFNLDSDTNKFVRSGSQPDKPFKPFEIGNNSVVSFYKGTEDGLTVDFATKLKLPKK